MPSPFKDLLSCLHRAPCWQCRETGHCHSPVLRHLMEYSQRLAAWARREPGVGEEELEHLAREYSVEVARVDHACAGLVPGARGGGTGRPGSKIGADERAGPAPPAQPL